MKTNTYLFQSVVEDSVTDDGLVRTHMQQLVFTGWIDSASLLLLRAVVGHQLHPSTRPAQRVEDSRCAHCDQLPVVWQVTQALLATLQSSRLQGRRTILGQVQAFLKQALDMLRNRPADCAFGMRVCESVFAI